MPTGEILPAQKLTMYLIKSGNAIFHAACGCGNTSEAAFSWEAKSMVIIVTV
jgi:hypothetical protein